MNLSWKYYWRPTPKVIRKLADSLLAGAMTISTISFINDHKTLAYIVLIVAGCSKFLSNFLTDDPEEKETQPDEPQSE